MTPESAQKRAEERRREHNECGTPYFSSGLFQSGYMAAWHDLAPKIEKLVEALEFCSIENASHRETSFHAREALQEFKK